MTRILILALIAATGTAAEVPAGERFSLERIEVLEPAPTSADGRYVVQASARLQDAPSSGQRFQLKSTLADCPGTTPGDLLIDGFEG